MTVHAWGTSDRTAPAPAGARWLAADVEFCLSPSVRSTVPIGVITNEFRLQTAAGSHIAPDTAAADESEAFADPDGTLADRACARGPVVFAVPSDAQPEYFLLASPLGTLRWRLV